MQDYLLIGGELDSERMALPDGVAYSFYPEHGAAIHAGLTVERVSAELELARTTVVAAPDSVVKVGTHDLLAGQMSKAGAHPQTIVYGVHHDLERDVVVMEAIGLVVGLPPAVYRGV